MYEIGYTTERERERETKTARQTDRQRPVVGAVCC